MPLASHGSELYTLSERLKTIYKIKIKKTNKFVSQNYVNYVAQVQ